MHIKEILEKNKISFSFEFFPPKTERSSDLLFEHISELIVLKPAYISVTYGAGGSTRDLTHNLVLKIQNQTNLTVIPHLTCVGSTVEEIHSILTRYKENDIKNIMALRGDPPIGSSRFIKHEGGFQYASELVAYIRKHFPETGIGVAGYPEGHPETPNRMTEMDNLKRKVEAGADSICPQFFFENNEFYAFCERCELAGIKIPIIAGIMPVASVKGMYRMAEIALGTKIPAKLQRAILRADGNAHVEKVGIHWATEQVLDLIDNDVKGIHFYTLNQSRATRSIYESLGVSDSISLSK